MARCNESTAPIVLNCATDPAIGDTLATIDDARYGIRADCQISRSARLRPVESERADGKRRRPSYSQKPRSCSKLLTVRRRRLCAATSGMGRPVHRTRHLAVLSYRAKLMVVPPGLSYELHKLTALLDRAADEVLRREEGISYARFLALFAVGETNGSQRDLARWLGQTEASTSRMVTVLADEGLLEVARLEGSGNRRQLRLTNNGAQLVGRCGHLLEGRFEDLVRRSGVPLVSYQRHTRRLLQQLDFDQGHYANGQEAV